MSVVKQAITELDLVLLQVLFVLVRLADSCGVDLAAAA